VTGVRCGRFSRRRRRRFARPVHGRVRPPSISYRIYCSTARIWVSVQPGRFRLAGLRFGSRTPIESPLTPRVRGDSHAPLTRRSTAQYAPIPPSYSDKPGTATIVARGDGVARLRQSRASEMFGVRASDPRKRMGGTYCMWESAGVGSGIPAYRPAEGDEVVINRFITACVVFVGDGR